MWMEKVEELAGRGLTIRQLLGFYSELGGSLMPHFDPDRSTTHDVVRQAIIPSSLKLRTGVLSSVFWSPRTSQSFLVVVHGADDLDVRDIFSSDPYCVAWRSDRIDFSPEVVSVSGKPWKGGGRTATMKGNCNPAWEEVGTATINQRSQDEGLVVGRPFCCMMSWKTTRSTSAFGMKMP